MDELKHIGRNVYMAYGKVAQVDDPSVDTSTDEGRRDVLEYAKALFSDKFSPRPWGVLTAGVMLPRTPGPAGMRHGSSRRHFGHFPEDVKEALRKEFPQHAGQI